MMSFGVFDKTYRDYFWFDTEDQAREWIDKQVEDGTCFTDDFRLFRRQELEI